MNIVIALALFLWVGFGWQSMRFEIECKDSKIRKMKFSVFAKTFLKATFYGPFAQKKVIERL